MMHWDCPSLAAWKSPKTGCMEVLEAETSVTPVAIVPIFMCGLGASQFGLFVGLGCMCSLMCALQQYSSKEDLAWRACTCGFGQHVCRRWTREAAGKKLLV